MILLLCNRKAFAWHWERCSTSKVASEMHHGVIMGNDVATVDKKILFSIFRVGVKREMK